LRLDIFDVIDKETKEKIEGEKTKGACQ